MSADTADQAYESVDWPPTTDCSHQTVGIALRPGSERLSPRYQVDSHRRDAPQISFRHAKQICPTITAKLGIGGSPTSSTATFQTACVQFLISFPQGGQQERPNIVVALRNSPREHASRAVSTQTPDTHGNCHRLQHGVSVTVLRFSGWNHAQPDLFRTWSTSR